MDFFNRSSFMIWINKSKSSSWLLNGSLNFLSFSIGLRIVQRLMSRKVLITFKGSNSSESWLADRWNDWAFLDESWHFNYQLSLILMLTNEYFYLKIQLISKSILKGSGSTYRFDSFNRNHFCVLLFLTVTINH